MGTSEIIPEGLALGRSGGRLGVRLIRLLGTPFLRSRVHIGLPFLGRWCVQLLEFVIRNGGPLTGFQVLPLSQGAWQKVLEHLRSIGGT